MYKSQIDLEYKSSQVDLEYKASQLYISLIDLLKAIYCLVIKML